MAVPRRAAFFLATLVIAAAVAACGSAVTPPSGAAPSAGPSATSASATTPAPTATARASLGRADGWRADIAALVPGMAAIHPDLTHGTSRAELDGAAAALATTVDTASDDELMVGVLRIVALVSRAGCDAHTGAYVWGSGTYPVESLPLRLWLFPRDDGEAGDDVVIVDALPPYADLVGSRIDSVDGHSIAEVLAAIDPIVPRDNRQTVRLLTPRFLLIPQVLRGLGLAGDGAVSLGLAKGDGPATTVDVQPVPMATYNAWAGPYGLHLPADPTVRYLSRIDDALWWDVLDDEETLFVQYNRVDPLQPSDVADLQAAIGDPAIARIVLDLRHNYGGELSALNAMTPILAGAANGEADRLFVFIGRNTFSAGSLLAARLLRDAKATLLGEATGGCPTIWSDPVDLPLPWSGITVSVAGDVAVGVDPNDPRLTVEPSVSAVLTLDEWQTKVDPALEQLTVQAP
jgi:hypothetical protein